jgi:hypothetical protein
MNIAIAIGTGAAGYAVVLAGLAVVVHPMRRRMYVTARDMMRSDGWTPSDRNEVRAFLWFSTSLWTGFLLPIACVAILAEAVLGRYRMPKPSALDTHPDAERFAGMAFVSMFAANPIFVTASLPGLLLIGAIVAFKSSNFSAAMFREALEDTILLASTRLVPAR